MERKIKVLMVDDEDQFRATTEKLLTRRGFEMIMAESGKKAIEKMSQHPDVVILDIKMPDMDGHQTLREMKKIDPELPVIMLTGHGEVNSALQARHEGALDYLSKPCDVNLLVGKIKEAFLRGAPRPDAKEKTVTDIMIPIDEYTLLSEGSTIREAIARLRESFNLKMATSRLMETGHRSILVVDQDKNALGILAITDLLKTILPAYLSAPKPSLADSIQYSPIFWNGMFTTEVRQMAETRVIDVMSPVPLAIDGEASLMEATYMMIQNKARRLLVVMDGAVVGLVREQDLFFEMARILNLEGGR